MANHGYLGEGYGKYRDVDDDRDRERGSGGERNDDREGSREWFGGRGGDRERDSDFSRGRGEWADRERGDFGGGRERGWDPAREGWGSGFGGGGARERSGESGGRGFFDRAREQVSGWMSDDDDDDRGGRGGRQRTGGYGREHGVGGFQGDFSGGGRGQGGFGGRGDWEGGRQSMGPRGDRERESSGQHFGYNDLGGSTGGFGNQRFGSSPHDHYLSWRERQIAELDRDYQDYCREREQSFHQDFDSWRQSRQGRQSQGQDPMLSGQEGSSSSGGSSARPDTLELTNPSSAATLGEAEPSSSGSGS